MLPWQSFTLMLLIEETRKMRMKAMTVQCLHLSGMLTSVVVYFPLYDVQHLFLQTTLNRLDSRPFS